MTNIHVSLKATAAAGPASTGTDSGSQNELEALQKKLTGLIDQLKEASHDHSPGAKERLKLLQLAIRACEMQIERLINAAAQKAAKKAAADVEAGTTGDRTRATGTTGSQIDTHA